MGAVVVSRGPAGQSENGRSGAPAQALVGASPHTDAPARAQRLQSRTTQSNQRWAMDGTHIPCGQMTGAISRPSLIVITARLWAMSSPYAGGPRKPNGSWKRLSGTVWDVASLWHTPDASE